ncbi:uncharacterized protein SEPMUDRAFT_150621 [Sphaerulina musiva SO2202]|uniref:DUF7924 domain-containing protein n=1 Tax=Sphaerulina musiva (strain SO2202) TaxID=692275 RepID=N1QHB1_SPHMS|nr:uncharacterized protein SEPMUDRAFT_150621 [Sphaerulina musiva SO2202]EMF10548.1 hypothetical protein SEPMUDRAFT_150621 [Sphaerulina musiva SO2202]
MSTQETKPRISLSEGAPRSASREDHIRLPNSRRSGSSGKKRRRHDDEQALEQSQEPCCKRKKEESEQGQEPDSNCRKDGAEKQDPVQYWARTGEWPKDFGQLSEPESDGSNKRRRSSTPSYLRRARDTAAYEAELQRYGIVFDNLTTKDLVTAESKAMCQALLSVDDLAPAYNFCSEDMYIRIFERASKCNEERVRRDLTPHIVPSAELLYILDQVNTLENVKEEMSADWNRCSLLGGTQPRPDYAYGLSSATFNEEERQNWRTTPISTTLPSSRSPCTSHSSCASRNAERRISMMQTDKTYTVPASPSTRSFSCAALPENKQLKASAATSSSSASPTIMRGSRYTDTFPSSEKVAPRSIDIIFTTTVSTVTSAETGTRAQISHELSTAISIPCICEGYSRQLRVCQIHQHTWSPMLVLVKVRRK